MRRAEHFGLATTMTQIAIVALCAAVVVFGQEYRDRLDLSLPSLYQTFRNLVPLPRLLGGATSVDSDVRFGRSRTPDDPLVDVAARFAPSRFDEEAFMPARVRNTDGGPFESISRMGPRRPFERVMEELGRFDPDRIFGGAAPIVAPRDNARTKGVDDETREPVDFMGLTGHMFNPASKRENEE